MHIITVQEMRRLDQSAIAAGISGEQLMFNAGTEAAETLLRFISRYPPCHRRGFTILAGKGNNGGDAWVVAAHLTAQGYQVQLCSTCQIEQLPEAAARHAARLPEGVPIHYFDGQNTALPLGWLRPGNIIVDGLLGTGLRGAPKTPYQQWITQVNEAQLPTVALDIPSGVNGDTGQGQEAIIADATITMAYPKAGLFLKDGERCRGQVKVVDIGLPREVADTAQACGEAITIEDVRPHLSRRPANAHKNSCGHVLCVAGSHQYPGAPFLAAEASLRSGSGLVTVALPAGTEIPSHARALLVSPITGNSEGVFSAASIEALPGLLAGRNALLYGPGTGRAASQHLLRGLLSTDLPLVIDADGLRLLAEQPHLLSARTNPNNIILTPHPGEMAALLHGFGLQSILAASRPEQAESLALATGAVVVLKGAGTIIAAPGQRFPLHVLSGNPSLATAGTGDVLAGMIAAFLTQGLRPLTAAAVGTFAHGHAADLAPAPQRALIADDLLQLIPQALADINPLA